MIELLSPAGNFEKLKAALLYGADAVYCEGQAFGMRSAAENFTVEELYEATAYTHARGKKLYLTVNTLPHEGEYQALKQFLCEIKDAGVDAFIVADLGVMTLLREIIPPEESNDFCHRMVDHGRAVCTARTAQPYCERCCMADICPKKI